MQIAEKWQLPRFRLGICTAEKPLVEFRSSRLAGLIGTIQRELLGGARKHIHKLRVGRASWPLGGSASAKAGPKSSESEAAVCRISSSPKETVSRALGLGNRKSCKNSTSGVARTRSGEGEKRQGLSAHSPSPRARHPNPRSLVRPRSHEDPRRCSMRAGEKWRIPSHNPQAESRGLWDGNRRKSCISRSRKPHHVHAKTPST